MASQSNTSPIEADFNEITPTKRHIEADFNEITPIKERKSQQPEKNAPFTHLVGGVGKGLIAIPTILPGAIGASGEAFANLPSNDEDVSGKLVESYFPDPKPFMKEFFKAAQSGVDSTLLRTGFDLIEKLTNVLGINIAPKRTINQIADLAGSFAVPLPGSIFGGPAAKGILGGLGKTAVFLSPGVRVASKKIPEEFVFTAGDKLARKRAGLTLQGGGTKLDPKVTSLRFGTSLGVGTGIEQGVRALINDPEELPLLFSEKALTGKSPSPIEANFNEIQPIEADGSELIDLLPPNFISESYFDPVKAAADQAQQEAENIDNLKWLGIWLGLITGTVLTVKYNKILRAAIEPALPFGTGGSGTKRPSQLRDATGLVNKEPASGVFGIGGKVEKAKELAKNRLKITRGNQIDADLLGVQQSRAAGAAEHLIDDVRGQGRIDSQIQAEEFLQRAMFPNGETVSMSVREMKDISDRWPIERQEQFLAYIAAGNEDIVRTKAVGKDFAARVNVKTATGEFVKPKKTGETPNYFNRSGKEEFTDEDIEIGNVFINEDGVFLQIVGVNSRREVITSVGKDAQNPSKIVVAQVRAPVTREEVIRRLHLEGSEKLELVEESSLFSRLNRAQKKAAIEIQNAVKGIGIEDIPNEFGHTLTNIVQPFTHGDLEQRLSDYARFVTSVRKTDKRPQIGLWKNNDTPDRRPTTDAELNEAIKAGNLDEEFKAFRKHLIEYNSIPLKDAAARGVQDPRWVDATIRAFSRGDEPLYIPSQQTQEVPNLFTRLGMKVGIGTTEGKHLNIVGSLQKKALEESEGVQKPMSPWHTTANNVNAMLEHTNRSVAQMNWMKLILGIEQDAKTGFATLDKDGFLLLGEVDPAALAFRDKMFFQKTPTYIGKISPDDPTNQFNSLNLQFYTKDEKLGQLGRQKIADLKKFLGSEDPGTAQMAMQEIALVKDSLIIQHQGTYHIFGNMDPAFKRFLEFDKDLINNVAKATNFFRRIVTMNTTGRYSTFGPTAFVYNASIGSTTAALKASKGGVTREAIQIWRDGIKGAVDIVATNLADDYARLIGHTLATGTGIGSSQPKLLKALEAKLQVRAKNHMMRDLRSKTGRIGASGQDTGKQTGSVTDNLAPSVNYIRQKYGGNVLPQMIRIWDHLNTGLHEGVAFGAILRKLGGTTKGKTPNQMRIAQRQVDDLIGNTQLTGASAFAKQMTAAFPYYGATIQGITTLGRAAIKAGTIKTVARLTAVIGMPVFLESVYNSFIDGDTKYQDASGRWWTHNEWWWHGWTPEQRAGNFIVQIPGRKPWEAFIKPVVPEVGAIRGFYLDAIELMYGLANIPGISNEQAFSIDHISVSAARAANVSLPPWVMAAASAFGVDVRAGLSVEGDAGEFLIQQRELPSPNRQTPNLEQARWEGGEFGVRVRAFIQNIGGALTIHAIKAAEGFLSGDESTPTSEKVTAGFDALGRSLLKTSKIPSAIFSGRVLSGGSNPAVSRQVFNKREALKRWVIVNATQTTGGAMSGDFPKQGRTSKITLDPVSQALAATANTYAQEVASYEREISNLNKRINSLHHSLVNTFEDPNSPIRRGPITVLERDELINSYEIAKGKHKETILSIYKTQEAQFALRMGKVLGRPLSGFTFEGWEDRANPSSTSPGLPNLPQTSR